MNQFEHLPGGGSFSRALRQWTDDGSDADHEPTSAQQEIVQAARLVEAVAPATRERNPNAG